MDKEIRIDLVGSFRVVKSKWWIVAIFSIIAFIAAYFYTYRIQDDEYMALSTIYSVANGSYEDTVKSAYIMKTYTDVIKSRKLTDVAASMIANNIITGEEILNMIKVNYSDTSNIVEIYAYSIDGDLAVKVANAVADSFVTEITNMTGEDTVQSLDVANTANVYRNAQSIRIGIRVLAVMAVMMISILSITLREIFASKLHDIGRLRLETDIEVIGIIPFYENV